MSYDYSFFNAPGPGPMSEWDSVDPSPLGTIDEVKARIAALFPETEWTLHADTWWGRTAPLANGIELQVTPGDDGACRWVTARRITREEVARLCRGLGVVAVDDQTLELIRS
jgi:hypothetical protein